MKKALLLVACCTTVMAVHAQWTTVCGTGNGMVVDLAGFDDHIYATGFFTTLCGTNSDYIARWDGMAWQPVDTGLHDAGHRLAVIDNELYVAGYEQTADSNWLLRWDGSHFLRTGHAIHLTTATTGSRVPNMYDVVKYRGRLVICGEFDRAGDRSISGIAQWTGTGWESLGTGLSGYMGVSGVIYPHQMLVGTPPPRLCLG